MVYMEVKKNLELPGNISELNVGDTISVDCQFTLEDLPPGVYKMAFVQKQEFYMIPITASSGKQRSMSEIQVVIC